MWHEPAIHLSAIGKRGTLPLGRILFTIHVVLDLKRNRRSGDDSPPVRAMKPKKIVLCVDNNEQALSIFKIMLETRGYRVIACNNGESALEAFRHGGVDLVLTDLLLTDQVTPGIDGPRLIEEIKTLSPQTPVVLISDRFKIYERDTMADVFLPKGMHEPADLLEKIRLLLVRKRGPRRQMEVRVRAAAQATVA